MTDIRNTGEWEFYPWMTDRIFNALTPEQQVIVKLKEWTIVSEDDACGALADNEMFAEDL